MNKSDGCYLDINKAELPILSTFTLLCNTVALVVMCQMKGLTESIDYLLVTVLTANDTISTLVYMGMWLGDWISCGALMGSVACSVFGWLGTLTVVWSAGIVLIMCSCRYLGLVHPIYYRTKVSVKTVAIGLVSTCLFFMLLVSTPFVNLGMPFSYYKSNKICAFNFSPGSRMASHRVVIGVMSSLGLATVMCVVCFNIAIIKRLRANQISPMMSVVIIQQSRRTMFVSVTVVVSLVYCITYAPFLIRLMYDVVQNTAYQNKPRHSITMSLLFLNPLLNPIMYVLFNKRYRVCLIKIVRSLFRCFSSTEDN